MNFSRIFRLAVLTLAAVAAACTKDDAPDNRELDYGYVQFRLLKQGTQSDGTRAVPQISYLADAAKINVLLRYGNSNVSQTLNLTAANSDAAEFGLRSDKLKLLTGEYSMSSYTLYDRNDEVLYNGTNNGEPFEIVAGGLISYDLAANVMPRGHVTFELVKTGFDKSPADTRAGGYTFDEIKKADIAVQNVNSATDRYYFTGLPMKFSVYFDEENEANGTPGYRTSSSKCDSLLSLPAGNYRIYSYTLYNSRSAQLESRIRTAANPIFNDFTVEDNSTTHATVEIAISTEDDYIKDYMALKAIWTALNGETWSYNGENFPKGCNWNFNKDIDLWGDQPGVQLHSNGRVARLDLSDFGVTGDMPEELGQLDQMVELYIGTHNDVNLREFDPTVDYSAPLEQRKASRMENHKRYLSLTHPAPQMSEPCARGLREHGIVIPETALYEQGYTENQILDWETGVQKMVRKHDLPAGKLCNGVTSLPHSIGKLKNLEYLYIANGRIAEIPEEVAELESLTDLEIYNCPEMTRFPMAITQMPELVSVNISNNPQWSAEEAKAGLDALAQGPSGEKIQILYCTDGSLEELPASFCKMKNLGLLDLTNNRISKLPHLTRDVSPAQVYFDNNDIAEFPAPDGYFCEMEDMETFSAPNNRLETFPDIFKTNKYTISSVDLSGNRISGFPPAASFRGIKVKTLTLSLNPITRFPASLFGNKNTSIEYIVMRGCGLEEFEDDCFNGPNSPALQSLDLSYNHIKKLPKSLNARNTPYLYGVDVSHNRFSEFPYEPFDAYTLTIYAVRAQRDADGRRCLQEWPTGVINHTGLRALYVGSNDLRRVNDTISYLIYYLDISDNPNITFDASDICPYWRAGLYQLIYDKSQNILNCPEMLE